MTYTQESETRVYLKYLLRELNRCHCHRTGRTEHICMTVYYNWNWWRPGSPRIIHKTATCGVKWALFFFLSFFRPVCILYGGLYPLYIGRHQHHFHYDLITLVFSTALFNARCYICASFHALPMLHTIHRLVKCTHRAASLLYFCFVFVLLNCIYYIDYNIYKIYIHI